MTDLHSYVNGLFRAQRETQEIRELKEEILSNMEAKRDDLIAQGMDAQQATEKARESLPAVDFLLDGTQLTDVGKYRLACSRSLLLSCVLFWIFSMPLLFVRYAFVCYMGLVLVMVTGCLYILRIKESAAEEAFFSVTASKRRRNMVWMIWGLFFLVAAGTVAALTFGSNIWFGRPLEITGPYQLARVAVGFYLPLLTIFIPITFSSFTRDLLNSRKEQDDASEN